MNILAILSVIVLVLVIYVILIYNKFITKNNLCEEGWSGINVQLKRRYDLIPNLVSTVKGYSKHESDVLTNVIELRNKAMGATNIEDKNNFENQLSLGLKNLFALSESYPDLKASQNFLSLQSSLMEIEDNIQNARRYYNATVRDFNTLIQAFPSNIIASKFNFKQKQYFELESNLEKSNPKVEF